MHDVVHVQFASHCHKMQDILASLDYKRKNFKKFKRGISKISTNLYLGGVSDIKETSLKEHGISHVVNMAEELYTFRYPVEGLQVYRANLKDSESENLLQDLDSYLDFIHTAEQKGGHVLVHCIAGASRSASVVIAYLVKYAGMSLKEAYEHVSECRENVYPNRNFWRCLIEFEERVRNDNTVEIRPYLTGDEPDIHYDYIKSRILNGWFKELMMFFGMGLMILLIQLYDFTKDI